MKIAHTAARGESLAARHRYINEMAMARHVWGTGSS